MNRRRFVLFLGALPVLCAPGLARAASNRAATLYKDPACGCCADHARYLTRAGFAVTVVDDPAALDAIKAEYRVPPALQGCHSTVIEGYVIEGHVPAGVIERLLAERLPIRGLALPGMPLGSPGMGGAKEAPFEIVVIDDAPRPTVYAVE